MANVVAAIRLVVLCVLALSQLPRPAEAQKCGAERWPVKTLVDHDKSAIALEPEDVTVGELVAIPAPDIQLPNSSRISPTETTVFRVRAILRLIKKEADSDYHLVITDTDDPETTMIAEIPSPACSKGSGHATQFAKIRAQLDALKKKKAVRNQIVELEGVGFFDFLHNQTGVARNGLELHPVLAFSIAQ